MFYYQEAAKAIRIWMDDRRATKARSFHSECCTCMKPFAISLNRSIRASLNLEDPYKPTIDFIEGRSNNSQVWFLFHSLQAIGWMPS